MPRRKLSYSLANSCIKVPWREFLEEPIESILHIVAFVFKKKSMAWPKWLFEKRCLSPFGGPQSRLRRCSHTWLEHALLEGKSSNLFSISCYFPIHMDEETQTSNQSTSSIIAKLQSLKWKKLSTNYHSFILTKVVFINFTINQYPYRCKAAKAPRDQALGAWGTQWWFGG
jgi:hypothetical protein